MRIRKWSQMRFRSTSTKVSWLNFDEEPRFQERWQVTNQVAARSTSPNMATAFHARRYCKFIEIKSNLRRNKLHSNFSNRDNVIAPIQLRRESMICIIYSCLPKLWVEIILFSIDSILQITSLRKVVNRRKMWRTPASTGYSCEDFPSRTTWSRLFLRKNKVKPNTRPEIL